MSRRKQLKMPKDGYPAVCINGPMKGMVTKVKDPRAKVLAPMTSNPIYYCAVYKVTNQTTPLGEIACVFLHLLKRTNE